MKLPPAIVAMRLVEQGRTRFRLWFPLFLLWPLLLILLLLALLVSFVADAMRGTAGGGHGYARLVWGGMRILTETRGTEVRGGGPGRWARHRGHPGRWAG